MVTVADDALPIVTWNKTLSPLIVPENDPNIDPVAIAFSSTTVTVVPSCVLLVFYHFGKLNLEVITLINAAL